MMAKVKKEDKNGAKKVEKVQKDERKTPTKPKRPTVEINSGVKKDQMKATKGK